MTKEKIKLDLEKPIAFYPQLAKALGGIEEAIFIQQLYYWSDKGKDKDGWIYKSKREWEEETTLTTKMQDRIIRKLKEKGIVKTLLKKANGAPTLHYKLDNGMLQKVIMECYQREQSNVTKGGNPITETTTETTTENNSTELPPKGDEFSLNEIINLFQEVNPSYKQLFSNKTQRSATGRLLKEHGKEKLAQLIKILPQINSQQYAPTIITPLQLEDKLGNLKAFLQKEQGNKNKPIII